MMTPTEHLILQSLAILLEVAAKDHRYSYEVYDQIKKIRNFFVEDAERTT